MDPMAKMWASFIAIGLMLVASAIITFARMKTRGIVKFILSLIAFLLFIPIFLYAIISIF